MISSTGVSFTVRVSGIKVVVIKNVIIKIKAIQVY